MTKSLSDIAEAMKDIDFCMLVSRAANGALSGRPMSNNRKVAFEGTSWFFSTDDSQHIKDIAGDPNVALTYTGKAGIMGLVGAPGLFIHVEGRAKLIRDKTKFAEHWDKDLDRWFEQGVDTPGLVMIEIPAERIHYWDGEDQGEVKLPATAAA